MFIVLLYITLSSILIALANLCIRISITAMQTKGDPFLFYRLLASSIITSVIALLYSGLFSLTDMKMIIIGFFAGIMLGILMWLTGKTLAYGPAGISIAIINSACIMPPLIMAILFGPTYGHSYSFINGIGAILVFIGIVWGGWQQHTMSMRWLMFVGTTFGIHAVYLSFFQWRALTLNPDMPLCTLLPFHCDPQAADIFTAIMYFIAASIQYILPYQSNNAFLRPSEQKSFLPSLLLFGIIGGIINGLGGFSMIRATESVSSTWENSIIFPLYAVLLITFCNLWAYVLYKEKINIYALGLCFIGILISSR